MTEQVNCISDIIQGLRRRPAFKLMDECLLQYNEDIEKVPYYTCHMYERGDGEEAYIIIISNGAEWQVFNAYTGQPVSTQPMDPGPATYVGVGTSGIRTRLKFYTIGDTTFVLNKEVEVTQNVGTAAAGHESILIWVKNSLYGKQYNISLGNSIAASVTNPATVTIDTSTTHKQLNLSTSDLATALAAQIGTFGYVAGPLNNVLWIEYDTSDPALWKCEDSGNNEDMVLIRDQVDSYEDLPPSAPHGFKCKVKGLGKSDYDDFWVEFVSDMGDQWKTYLTPHGYWQECAEPGSVTGIFPYTLPHIIERHWLDGVPYFVCVVADWGLREAGDDTTNPFPSFVGRTITDLFTYQNRMWFLSGENACASRAFDYYQWFAESAAEASDDDPIDSSSSDNQITELRHGVVFNKDLFILSNTAQFLHPGEETVKPSTFAVSSNTKFPTNPAVAPVVMGNSLLFPSLEDRKVAVWEYKKDPLTSLPQVQEITAHIGGYIPGDGRIYPDTTSNEEVDGIEKIAVHPSKGLFFMASGGFIYVLQTYEKDGKRVQLAWHKWDIAQMEDYGGWYTSLDYTEHPTVSDVFVVGDKLIAIARFDARQDREDYQQQGIPRFPPFYFPRLISMDLNLLESTVDDPEIFLDYQYETSDQVTLGEFEYGGNWYNGYVELDYYKLVGKDPTTGSNREQWFDSVVITSSSDTDTVPNGVEITDYQQITDPAGFAAGEYLMFNVPSAYESTSFSVTVGCKFPSYFTLSKPYVKDSQGRPYTEDAQVEKVTLDMNNAVYWEAQVGNESGDGYTHVFNGQFVNDWRCQIGAVNHFSGTDQVAICNMRDLYDVTIWSDSLYGFGFDGATFHVNMHSHGRRT
jgi:hypothetical protein